MKNSRKGAHFKKNMDTFNMDTFRRNNYWKVLSKIDVLRILEKNSKTI